MNNQNVNLIAITTSNIGGELIETVNARELHEFLESRQEFSNWIKGRIRQYGFVEGVDFTIDKVIIGKATQIDYYITMDMAKELSMVERNEKGKQARQYFIECERVAKTVSAAPIDNSQLTAQIALAECYDRMLRPAPSSKVLMLQTIAKNNGVDFNFLPAYTVDAPDGSTTGSSEPTASLSSLLKENGIKFSARSYNTLLRDAGLLEQRTRKSAAGSAKVFWSITERGLKYGKNITNPQNLRETQPHWYVSRFDALHNEVMALAGGVA